MKTFIKQSSERQESDAAVMNSSGHEEGNRTADADLSGEKTPMLVALRQRQALRNRAVALLGVLVVLATAVALMVPAIAMTRGDLVCNTEEHTHSDACYEQVLACGQQEGEDHVHTDACYETKLTCDKPEHTHSDACYAEPEPDPEPAANGQAENQDSAKDVEGGVQQSDSPSSSDTGEASGVLANATVEDGASNTGAELEGETGSSGAVVEDEAGNAIVAAEKDQANPSAQTFSEELKDADGNVTLAVKVEAPAGALPEGATMQATPVTSQKVLDAAKDKAADEVDGIDASRAEVVAADITFFDADGKMVEPTADVHVSMSAPVAAGAAKGSEANTPSELAVVHVDDNRKAEVVASADVDAATASAEFDSADFSVYALVYTLANELVVDGKTYKITVTYDDAAGIPAGTELIVTEIEPETDEYIKRYIQTWGEVNHEYLEQEELMNSLPDGIDGEYKDIRPVNLNDARFFNITLLYNGEAIEPKAPVQVDVQYAEGLKALSDEMVIGVTHFKENEEIELIEDVETTKDEEGGVVNFAYMQDSFSDVGTFVGQEASDNRPLSYTPSINLPMSATKGAETELGEPKASKTLEPNKDDSGINDGTYTLSLNVTGQSIELESLTKANVLFIMDRSSSMTNNVYEKHEGPPAWETYYGQDSLGNFITLATYNGKYYYQYSYNEYTGTVYTKTSTTRLAAEQEAMKVLMGSLLEQNEEHPGTVMMSVISFADTRGDKENQTDSTWDTSVTETAWTDNEETLEAAVNSPKYHSGTNWEEALLYAQEKIDAIPADRKDEKTYVVFLTDGEPTAIHGETGGAHHYDNANGEPVYNGDAYGYHYDGVDYNLGGFDYAYNPARDDARDIVEAGYDFYTVMTFNPLISANKYLKRLTNYAYDYDGDGVGGDSIDEDDDVDTGSVYLTDKYFNASTPSELESAFEKIFKKIYTNIAHGQVKLTDGLTAGAMTTTFVSGSPTGVKYLVTKKDDNDEEVELYSVTARDNPNDPNSPIVTFHINGEDYSTTDTGDRQVQKITNPEGAYDAGTYYTITVGETEYKMALANIDSSHADQSTSGLLTWDLSPIGTLWGDCTYTAEFIVWPNQAAYDYVAALNNKDSGYNVDGSEGVEWDESKEDDAHLVEDSEGHHYWFGGVPQYPSIVKYKDGPNAGMFAVLTNTSQNLDYSIVTKEGDKEPVVVPQPQIPLDTPNPMPLTKTQAKIEKIWNVENGKKELYDLLYGDIDEETGKIKPFEIQFDIDQGGNPYTTISLPGSEWIDAQQDYDWENDKYYKSAYMTSYGDGDAQRSFSTHWIKDFSISTGLMLSREEMLAIGLDPDLYTDNLVSDKNGSDYYLLEDGHDYTIKEKENYELGYEFDFSEPSYHPVLVDGVLMDVSFEVVDGETTITKMEAIPVDGNGVSSLTAENTMRGYIHLNKVVVDKDGNQIDDDTEFEYSITLNNQNGLFTGTHIPWYAINGCFYRTEEGGERHYYQVDKVSGTTWSLKTEDGKTYEFTDPSFDKDNADAQTITYHDTEAGDDIQLTLLGNQMDASGTTIATKTLSIKQGQTLSIGNVPEGTQYTIVETPKLGYSLVDIDNPDAENAQYEDYEIDIDRDAGKITGIIIPDHDNGTTYTNRRVEADLVLYKVTKDSLDSEEKEFLKDAEFTITMLDEKGTGSYKVDSETEKPVFEKAVSTGEDGMAAFPRLQEGYYEIRETVASPGYMLAPEPDYFKVKDGVLTRLRKIVEDNAATEQNEMLVENWPENTDNTGLFRFAAAQAAVEDDPQTADVDETAAATNATYTVGNEPGKALPNTGGPGTAPFYLLGTMLIAFAGAGIIVMRRRRKAA